MTATSNLSVERTRSSEWTAPGYAIEIVMNFNFTTYWIIGPRHSESRSNSRADKVTPSIDMHTGNCDVHHCSMPRPERRDHLLLEKEKDRLS